MCTHHKQERFTWNFANLEAYELYSIEMWFLAEQTEIIQNQLCPGDCTAYVGGLRGIKGNCSLVNTDLLCHKKRKTFT